MVSVMVSRSKTVSSTSHNILLVDDNRSGLRARQSVLEELGFSTDGVSEARKALELFKSKQYDLVVTDYKMPGMDGVEFIARLREVEPQVPVILISGFVEALGLSESTTGANVVIMKCANEVQHLIRAATRLLKPAKRPPLIEKSLLSRTRKKATGA